jgi:cell wall-associated NlpC family hydrolase
VQSVIAVRSAEGEPPVWRHALPIAVLALLAGCGTPAPRTLPPPPRTVVNGPSLGDEIVLRAMAQIGTVYRYGGADLEGFDCSGLVYFIHQGLGLQSPRTAQQQFDASRRIARAELVPGDLVFFRFDGPRISHVGIYAGAGRFVHAPQSGRTVELKSLEDAYYARHFAGGGRLSRG